MFQYFCDFRQMHTGIGSLNGGVLIISRRRSMMASLRDQNESIRAKLEGDDSNTDNISKGLIAAHASASSSLTIGTSRQWSGFKNPRIVRVSRTFGGKDRHSKVCTIRGLRDRRIRLSVPTAIQLYDLQDRLGLNQPSKVIDWLIEATKLDIDELPPLHFPPGDFSQFHGHHSLIGQLANNHAPPHHFTPYLDANLTLMNSHPTYNSSSSMMLSHKEEGININDDLDDEDGNEEDEHLLEARLEKIKWNNKAGNSEQDQYQGQGIGCDGNSSAQVSAQSFLSPMGGSGGFLPSSMNSSSMLPYGNLYHWEPSNLLLSQYGSHGFLAPSEESNHLTSSSYPGGGNNTQHLFYCPPSMPTTTASLFPQNDNRFRSSCTSAGVNQLNDKGDIN